MKEKRKNKNKFKIMFNLSRLIKMKKGRLMNKKTLIPSTKTRAMEIKLTFLRKQKLLTGDHLLKIILNYRPACWVNKDLLILFSLLLKSIK